MAESVKFSESIAVLKEAHEDALAVLSAWRDLLISPGEVTLYVKAADGTTSEVVLPSIRAAIQNYLGGVFESITLATDDGTVTISLDENGQIVLTNANGTPANMIVDTLLATTIMPNGDALHIRGTINTNQFSATSGSFSSLKINQSANIQNAVLNGSATINGVANIQGRLNAIDVKTNKYEVGALAYSKAVLKWAVVGTVPEDAADYIEDYYWTGDQSALVDMGITVTGTAPIWKDCTYVKKSTAGNLITAYWDTGNLQIGGQPHVSFFEIMAWPYLAYGVLESGKYYIRMLPFSAADNGRIFYIRTGADDYKGVPTHIRAIAAASGDESCEVLGHLDIPAYSCARFMAYMEEKTDSGTTIQDYYLYRV